MVCRTNNFPSLHLESSKKLPFSICMLCNSCLYLEATNEVLNLGSNGERMRQRHPWEISYLYSAYSVRVLSGAPEGERTGANRFPTFASTRVIRLFSLLIFIFYIKGNRHYLKTTGAMDCSKYDSFSDFILCVLKHDIKIFTFHFLELKVKTLWRLIFSLLTAPYFIKTKVYVNMRICLPMEFEERTKSMYVRVRFFFFNQNKSLQTDELIHSYHCKSLSI